MPPRHCRGPLRGWSFACVLWLVATAPLAAQEGAPAPEGYSLALASLEAGDTAAALDRLRDVVEEAPDFGPAFFRLGAVLTELDTGHETDFAARREATRMLDRAHRLMGNDPELLLEYGLLLRKKQVRNDARRVLELAWEKAEERGRMLAPADRARFHFELGRYYEEYNEDWQGMVILPETAPYLACDGNIGPEASHCPGAWAERIDHAVPIDHLNDDDRERMLGHFDRAVAADPGHAGANTSILSYLADAGDWERYEEAARRFVAHAPDEPRAHLFLGLGLHERGRDAEAEASILRGVALLRPSERRVFEDIAILLPRSERDGYESANGAVRERIEQIVFTAKDPLFLTEVNERRLEHLARLAWAELKYAEPGSGHRGWESDRGEIWIRYGRPWRAVKTDAIWGRRVVWAYGRTGPVFSFRKQRTRRTAYHTDQSAYFAADLEHEHPESYFPTMVTDFVDVPHQLARFRGSEPGHTRVEIYAEAPVEELEAEIGDTLDTGIFTFLEDYTPIWERRTPARATPGGVALTYRFELTPGWYRYGIEARAAGPEDLPRPAARARSTVATEGFPTGRLGLSDLLLAADTVRPTVTEPTRREELRIVPLRGDVVRTGSPVHVYFEVYGLAPDSAGLGTYRAELTVEDSTRRNVVERLFRAGRDLIGLGTPETRVRWDRQVPVVDDLVPEYISLEVADLEPGEYTIRVRLTDLATGQAAETARAIRVRRDPTGTSR